MSQDQVFQIQTYLADTAYSLFTAKISSRNKIPVFTSHQFVSPLRFNFVIVTSAPNLIFFPF